MRADFCWWDDRIESDGTNHEFTSIFIYRIGRLVCRQESHQQRYVITHMTHILISLLTHSPRNMDRHGTITWRYCSMRAKQDDLNLTARSLE